MSLSKLTPRQESDLDNLNSLFTVEASADSKAQAGTAEAAAKVFVDTGARFNPFDASYDPSEAAREREFSDLVKFVSAPSNAEVKKTNESLVVQVFNKIVDVAVKIFTCVAEFFRTPHSGAEFLKSPSKSEETSKLTISVPPALVIDEEEDLLLFTYEGASLINLMVNGDASAADYLFSSKKATPKSSPSSVGSCDASTASLSPRSFAGSEASEALTVATMSVDEAFSDDKLEAIMPGFKGAVLESEALLDRGNPVLPKHRLFLRDAERSAAKIELAAEEDFEDGLSLGSLSRQRLLRILLDMQFFLRDVMKKDVVGRLIQQK
jgi:hypothetical protein